MPEENLNEDLPIKPLKRKMPAARNLSSDQLPERMTGFSYQVDTPGGRFFVSIHEHPESGLPVSIHINGLKNGSALAAWAQALSRLCTRALLNSHMGIADILEELSGITTDKSSRNHDGIRARSDIEGFVIALQSYQSDKLKESGILGFTSFDNPEFDRGQF